MLRGHVHLRNPASHAERVVAVTMDGIQAPIDDGWACIGLVRDGKAHEVEVILGPSGLR